MRLVLALCALLERPVWASRFSFLLGAACGLLCAAALTVNQAYAQAWPSRPIKVVVPFLAGSATDVTARLISERLAEYLGVSFVVVAFRNSSSMHWLA